MTDGTLFTGKTVEDALSEGLRTLGLSQEQVEVEVISRGSRGLFGIGSEPAQVRITPHASAKAVAPAAAPGPTVSAPRTEQSLLQSETNPVASEAKLTPSATAEPELVDEGETRATPPPEPSAAAVAEKVAPAPAADADDTDAPAGEPGATAGETPVDDDELVALAVELLRETVRLMGFEADVVPTWEAPDDDNDEAYLLLNLQGRDLGALIGRRGDTLNNLQYLLRLMVNQRLHQWKNIVVDVEQYRQHRAEHLTQLALRSAEQVAKSGRPLSLEPMPSNERRIIHLALRDHASVYTESSGEGERRKIQIYPKRG